MNGPQSKKLILVFQCFIIVFFGALFLFTLDSFGQDQFQTNWSNSVRSLTIFQPGDAVRIRVWELYQGGNRNLDLNGDYAINTEGIIIMPIIGEIRIKGLTQYELMQLLEDKLKAYLRNPYVYVRPLIRVTMQGAFNRPGSYRVDPSASLWDLVRLAGGPRANCDLRKIEVERGGKVIIKNLLESFEEGYSLEEVGIESGDQIMVPQRGSMNLGVLLGMINLVASIVLLYLRLRYRTW